jgi:hypothetical protein
MSRPRPFCLLFNLMKGAFPVDNRLHSRCAELEAEAKRREAAMTDNDNALSSPEMLRHRFAAGRREPTLVDLGQKLEAAWTEERLAWEAYRSDTQDISDDNNPAWLRAHMLQDRTYQIVKQIVEGRAATIEELRVKARATLWAHGGEFDFDGDGIDMQAVKSVIEGLLAA